MRDRNRRQNIFLRCRIANSRAVPDAAPVGGDVDFCRIIRVEDDAMTPLEVITFDPVPMCAPVSGTIGRRIEPRDIEHLRMPLVHRQIVNMLRVLKDRLPRQAGVRGKKNSAAPVYLDSLMSPRREIQPVRVSRIDGEPGGSVHSFWKIHFDPVLCFVCRAVERSRPGNWRISSFRSCAR